MTSKNFVFNRCIGEFVGHSNLVWSVCLQKDLILYSGGTNGRLIAWNAQSCKPIGSMQCQGTPTALGAMRLVVAAAGDRVIVTEVMPNGMFAPVKFATVPVINPTVPRNHPQHIINVVSHCIDADRLFVGYVDGYIRLWFQGKLAREYAVHRGEVLCIEKDGDTLFSGGSDQAVFAMNARDGKPFALYRGQHGPIRAINVFGNKLCIATGNAIRVQTVDSGDLLQRLCGHAHPIFCLLRDRNLLYSGSGDRKVFVWNLDTLWPIMEIQTGHMGRIKCMCLSSTGILYTGSSDKNIRKFSMAEAFQSLEQWKQANPGAGQPPKRQKAVDTAGTLTAGVMKDMRASQMSITELVDLLPVPQGVSSGGGGGAMDSFIPPNTNNNNNVENSWASSVRIGGSDAFLVPTVPMKTTLKEDSTDDYYGKLSLVNAGRGVLNAPDVDERALPAPPSADFVDPNFPDTPPISDGPPLPPRQGLAPEAGDQVYTAPRPPPRKPPLAPRTAPRPAGLPDPSTMSSPTFGSSVPTFAGADAAMSNTYSQPVAEGEGFVCDQCGKAYVTPTDLDIHISKRHGGVGGALDNNAGEYRAPSDSYQNLPINTSELTLEGHSTAEWENDNSYMSLPANAQMRQPDF